MHSWTSFSRSAVFISGGGSTLQAILDMQEFINVCIIVTNKKNILGLIKAKRAGVQVHLLSKNETYSELDLKLKKLRVQKIILAGYMRIIPEEFLQRWSERIFNIHPSLLPTYKGLRALENSFQDHADMGVTLHHVSAGVDEGKIWLQKKALTSAESKRMTFEEAHLHMRAAEQSLLREFVMKGFTRV